MLVALIAGPVLFFRAHRSGKTTAGPVIPTTKAARGPVRNTVRLSGTIAATRYADVVAPMLQSPDHGHGMVLLSVPPSGSMVREGEIVAQMDNQVAEDHLADVEATVLQGQLELRRLKATQDAQMETVRQRARVAKGVLDKALQDARASEAKTKIDQELLKLAVEEAREAYQEAMRQVEMTAQSQASAMRVAEYEQQRQVRHRDRHRTDLERTVIKASMSGHVLMRPIFRHGEQGQVRVGDELSPGQAFMRIVDISRMHLETSMNQAESELVRLGQRAMIRFDAYPDIKLNGKVVSVGTLAIGGRRVNYFIRRVPVRIAIDGTDPRVLPDLTASADVVVAEQDDSIVVPRQAVLEEDGKPVVYVRQAGMFTPREVALGVQSNTEAAVLSGLHPGEEVALEKPF